MRQVCEALHIAQLFTAVHHPQTDGLTERLNQTIKAMLQKLAYDHPEAWDLYVDPLLFALRETPQASTGVAPFELLYGRIPRGILGLTEDQAEGRGRNNPQMNRSFKYGTTWKRRNAGQLTISKRRRQHKRNGTIAGPAPEPSTSGTKCSYPDGS